MVGSTGFYRTRTATIRAAQSRSVQHEQAVILEARMISLIRLIRPAEMAQTRLIRLQEIARTLRIRQQEMGRIRQIQSFVQLMRSQKRQVSQQLTLPPAILRTSLTIRMSGTAALITSCV